jgi:uncharacterized protein YciI
MFVILSTYLKGIEEVDQFLLSHRNFLQEGYEKNYFIASGPQNPRTGGVILSQLQDKKTLLEFLAHDPFQIHGIAHYEVIEFSPVKYHESFKEFI